MKMEWKTGGWARARSSAYDEIGKGQALALREGAAFFIVARGPSDATRASERVSPATLGDL